MRGPLNQGPAEVLTAITASRSIRQQGIIEANNEVINKVTMDFVIELAIE